MQTKLNKLICRNKKLGDQNSGFAILYAVLVSSLLLAIGLMVFNLTIKELFLSSLNKESQTAFYAADTGLECAFYHDIQDAFSIATPAATIACAGNDAVPVTSTNTGQIYTRSFRITLTPEVYCADVVVTKDNSVAPLTTKIESRGRNTCDTAQSNRVERALRATY